MISVISYERSHCVDALELRGGIGCTGHGAWLGSVKGGEGQNGSGNSPLKIRCLRSVKTPAHLAIAHGLLLHAMDWI